MNLLTMQTNMLYHGYLSLHVAGPIDKRILVQEIENRRPTVVGPIGLIVGYSVSNDVFLLANPRAAATSPSPATYEDLIGGWKETLFEISLDHRCQ